MDKKLITLGAALGALVVIGLVGVPYLLLWALHALGMTTVGYGMKAFLAALVLGLILGSSSYSRRRPR